MPRKRGTRPFNDPLGPAAIGAALKIHWRDIDWREINATFDRWRFALESTYKTILFSEDAGLISHEDKFRRILERDNWLGGSTSSVGLLVIVLQKEGAAEFMRELWRRNGVAAEEIEKELARRPELPDSIRGQDLKTAVEQCMTALKELVTNPTSQDISALGSCCLKAILRELRRLGILGICDYCGLTFFPTNARKQVCSEEYEGRNCSGKRRAKRWYENSKGRTR